MNLTLRWKLILSISIPLLLTYVGLLGWDYVRQRDAAVKQMQDLATERAASAAATLDARLSSVMQLVDTTATVLTNRPNLTEGQVRALLLSVGRQNPWVAGAAIAFDPATDAGRGALAIQRGAGGFPRLVELPADGEGHFVDEPWYAGPSAAHAGAWTEPYRDPVLGAGEAVATYAVPFQAADGTTFRGVVAVSLRTEDLQHLRGRPHRWMPFPIRRSTTGPTTRPFDGNGGEPRGPGGPPFDRPDRPDLDGLSTTSPIGGPPDRRGGGGGGPLLPPPARPATMPAPEDTPEEAAVRPQEFVIVDAGGRIVSHPNPAMVQQDSIFRLAQQRGMTELADAGRAAVDGESGVVRVLGAADLFPASQSSDGYHWVAFAPIPSTGWVFAATLPESTVMGPILQRLWSRAAFLLAGLVVLIGVVLLVAIRMSQPIERLAAAVRELGTGNLDVRVTDVHSRDEFGQLAAGFNRMVGELKSHVEELTAQSAARARVEGELKVARQIQSDLLPKTFPPFPDRTEFDLYALNVPARDVGGDFYDFFFAGDRLTVVIADVSGKGVPAALLMAVTRTIIRNLASSGLSPAEIVDRANTLLVQDMSDAMFVTMFLAQYDPATGAVTYVNAGHPPPYRVSAGGRVKPFGDVTAPLMGAVESSEIGPFEQGEDRLEPGESLVAFTDGVTEARAPTGELLGDAGLVQVLTASPDGDPRAMADHVAAAVHTFEAGQAADDVTVLVLRRNR